jgi:DNA-binding NtrC family response regulator
VRLRVLIVDDEELIADTLATILRQHGFEVWVAFDGETAIDVAMRVKPEVVITDVVMPGGDGVQTAIAITDILPRVRVLLFSGHSATGEILEEARRQGREFEILPKPFRPQELLEKLEGYKRAA